MKLFHVVPFLTVLAFLPAACTHTILSGPPSIVSATPTPTPVPPPPPSMVTISVNSSFRYSTGGTGGASLAAPVTVSAGSTIIWDTSNGGIHPLYLDNSTVCMVSNQGTGFPMTQVLAAGTYNFHCGNHGACSSGNSMCPNTTCGGMAATIVVQ